MKFFSKKTTRPERLVASKRNQLNIFPERDWKIILTTFVVLNLAALGFHAYLFFEINSGGFFSVPEPMKVEIDSVNQNRLEKTLEVFSEKEAALIKKIAEPEEAPSVR